MSDPNTIYAREGYFITETRVVVNEFFEFESSILPSAAHHLEREIIVKQGAKIFGDIAGGMVILGQNVTVMGSIICDNLRIGVGSTIEGGVYARFEVEIEPDAKIGANVFGEQVHLSTRVVVDGHVMGTENVKIEDGCTISGLVFSHGWLKFLDLSEANDLIAVKDIILGSHVLIHDSTIWSVQGKITFGKNNLINSQSENPKLLEDTVHAFRKKGTELSSLLPEGYYYVHGIDSSLHNNFKKISNGLFGELKPMVEIDLPIGEEDLWQVRSITQSIDFENLKRDIESARLYDKYSHFVRDLFFRFEYLSDRVSDLYLNGGSEK